jgi:N-acetylglucosaminyl-diphospho-decaprenol L-rhamnosyltransferase
MKQLDITLSVVSHGQIEMVTALLQDIATNCQQTSLEVILTLNIPEDVPVLLGQLPFSLRILHNESPLGFGENHNRAFKEARAPYFCVINPDIRMDSNLFPVLVDGLQNSSFGVITPLIVNGEGAVEDSARKFPTPFKILCKLFGGGRRQDYSIGSALIEPDWVGGMFMVFRRDTYALLGGFDQKFFLYYEDVDLCARIRLQGLRVVMIPSVRATHLARRSSHTSAAYSFIHIRSMFRFFTSTVFFKVLWHRGR